MDWIKKNTDQFVLALLALVLLLLSGFLIFKSLNFGESFSAIQTTPPRNDTIPPLQMAVVSEAQLFNGLQNHLRAAKARVRCSSPSPTLWKTAN
jgi:hypothetical protein